MKVVSDRRRRRRHPHPPPLRPLRTRLPFKLQAPGATSWPKVKVGSRAHGHPTSVGSGGRVGRGRPAAGDPGGALTLGTRRRPGPARPGPLPPAPSLKLDARAAHGRQGRRGGGGEGGVRHLQATFASVPPGRHPPPGVWSVAEMNTSSGAAPTGRLKLFHSRSGGGSAHTALLVCDVQECFRCVGSLALSLPPSLSRGPSEFLPCQPGRGGLCVVWGLTPRPATPP